MAKKQNKLKASVAMAALEQSLHSVVGHLDLEGVAYIKITRTGKQSCFSMDATGATLRGENAVKLSWKELSELWDHPACEKNW